MNCTILIVDDEATIREGITKSIEWDKYGFDIIGEATNGVEALEKTRQLNPDIILTDIKMPKMDGLELCEKIKSAGLAPKIVILTGYSDFGYAKQAIKLNVIDYLMKPIGADELIKILQKIKKTINFERVKNISYDKNKELLDSNLKNIQHNYIIKLMRNETIQIHNSEETAIFPNSFKNHYLLFVSIRKYISKVVETSNYYLIEEIISIIDKIINKNAQTITFYYENNNIVSLINSDDSEYIKEIFRTITVTVKSELDIDIHGYFYDKNIEDLQNLSTPYKAIMDIMDYRLFLNKSNISTLNSMENYKYKPDFVFPIDLERELLKCIDDLKLDLVISHLKTFFDIIGQSNIKYNDTRLTVSKIINSVLEHLKYIEPSINNIMGVQFDPYVEFKNYDSIKDIWNWIQNLISNLVEIIKANQKNKYKIVIQKAILYIENNYDKEITLKILSDAVYVTPNYLCKVFKEETGINYKDWINQYRLNKAKDLLKNSYLKVYEIAYKSGYNSYKYFVQTFKKYNNYTPKQYRKKYMNVK